MVYGPEGLRAITQRVIEGRDKRGAKNWRPENSTVNAFVTTQPFLFVEEELRGERQLRGIRFQLYNGTIYMPSWIHKTTTGKETEVPFKTNLKGEGEMYLRWKKQSNIEAATRSTVHISRDYGPGGIIRQNAEKLLEFLDDLSDRFESKAVKRENLPEVIEETLSKLEETGFLKVIKYNKVKLRNQLLETLGPDSLDRFPNLLIILTKLASNSIRVRHEEHSASKVTIKYDRWFDMLYEKRLYERHGISRVLRSARELRRQYAGRTNHTEFRKLVFKLKELSSDLRFDTICTAPYRVPSLLFTIGLFGTDEQRLRYEGNESVDKFVSKLIRTLPRSERKKHKKILKQRPIDEIIRDHDLSSFEKQRQITERLEIYYTPLLRAFKDGRNWRVRTSGEILAV